MRLTRASLLTGIFLLAACAGGGSDDDERSDNRPALPPDMPDMMPTVVLETSVGRIVLELDRGAAPKSVENIVGHVRAGFYDGLTFHRVIPGFMIQGGGFNPEMGQVKSSRPPVPNEADNGLKNVRGSVAMARTNDPHSATTQFFINVADNPRLDHTSKTPQGWGYAVIGHVTEGIEVVDSIVQVPTRTVGPHQNVPAEPVVIERAYVRDDAATSDE